MRLALVGLGFVFALASAGAQGVTKNIVYTTDSAGAQQADLYEPTGAGPFPAIVYIHGGSWRSGNKNDFHKLAADLAARGYVGFSIDYDLQRRSFPASWEEAVAAVTFLRAHAVEYHIDAAKIVVAGASAGGELAALVALQPDGPATKPNAKPVPVAAAIILSGVFDLSGSYGVIARYIGGPCNAVAVACKDSSPLKHVHAGAPPFFVGHGTSDHTVPYASAQIFDEKMKEAGNSVTFYPADGGAAYVLQQEQVLCTEPGRPARISEERFGKKLV